MRRPDRATRAGSPLDAGTPTAALGPDGHRRDAEYLDQLERELASWSERLAWSCDQPRRRTREARIEHRKRILVSKVRIRNIARRLADMRSSPASFTSLRPGLLLNWSLLTSGIEQAEAEGAATP